jgi:hypothetical protein
MTKPNATTNYPAAQQLLDTLTERFGLNKDAILEQHPPPTAEFYKRFAYFLSRIALPTDHLSE